MTKGEKIEAYIYSWFKLNKFPGMYTQLKWEDKSGCEISIYEQFHKDCPSEIGTSSFYYKGDISLYEQYCIMAEDWLDNTKQFSFPKIKSEHEFNVRVLKEPSENLLLLI